jgi:hypothetical protein
LPGARALFLIAIVQPLRKASRNQSATFSG